MNDRSLRKCLLERFARTGFDNCGWCQSEDFEYTRKTITAHIAERSAAEVIPAAPDKRQVGFIVGACRRRTDPHVPVEILRHRLILLRPVNTLGPVRSARPIVYFADSTDGSDRKSTRLNSSHLGISY